MPVSPKARVVIINGPAAVGKTTVGTLLASKASNGALIEGDRMANFSVRKTTADADDSLQYRSVAHLTDLYLESGYEFVVVDFQFDSTEHVWNFLDEYKGQAPVHMFSLWAPMMTCLQRADLDNPSQAEVDGFAYDWQVVTQAGNTLGEAVDAREGPNVAASAVVARMQAQGGMLLAPRWSSKPRRPATPAPPAR